MKEKKGKEIEKIQILSFIKRLKLDITDPYFPYFDPPDFHCRIDDKKISIEHTRLYVTNGGKIKSTIDFPIEHSTMISMVLDRIEEKDVKEKRNNYSAEYDANWLLIIIGDDLLSNFISFVPNNMEFRNHWIFDKIYLFSIQKNEYKVIERPRI